MSETIHNPADLARGLIQISIQRLAGKYPFHARTLEWFVIRCRPEIATMGVTVAGDDLLLLYNPQFVIGITLDELGGALLHEVHHVVFGHILADPANYPDHWAWTIATELSVNEFVKEPLPGQPILLEQFPNLPPMESTNQRYKRLQQQTDRQPLNVLSAVMFGGLDGEEQSDSQQPVGVVLDDHSVWGEAFSDPERSEAALRAAVQDVVIDLGFDHVPEELREAIQGLGIGTSAGHQQCDLTGDSLGRLDWIRLLRRFVGRHLVPRPDFGRPPRRFPNLVGVVPGKRRRGGRPHVLAVIDTSASMTKELLEQVNGELSRLAADYHLTVAECDTQIQRVYSYRRIQSVMGRGGTDLRPPFETPFMQQHRPDLIIVFTDGFGPAPDNSPGVPVLWCLTPGGKTPAEWGEAVQMLASDGRNSP